MSHAFIVPQKCFYSLMSSKKQMFLIIFKVWYAACCHDNTLAITPTTAHNEGWVLQMLIIRLRKYKVVQFTLHLHCNIDNALEYIIFVRCSFQSKKEGKDQESIQSSTTSDPGYQWESDNFTIRHHKKGAKGQPFPGK